VTQLSCAVILRPDMISLLPQKLLRYFRAHHQWIIGTLVLGLVGLYVALPNEEHAKLSVQGLRSQAGTTDRALVAIKLVNGGQAAAEDLKVRYTCLASPYPIEEPWTDLKEPKIVKSPASQVVGVGSDTNVVCAFNKNHLRWIAEGKAFGYLVLNATYRDGSDKLHRLQWSQRIVHASKEPDEKSGYNLALKPHGKHNCVDDGCPE
jgi:hypothetical protein